jgi:outer membrane protein assembly factor BamE
MSISMRISLLLLVVSLSGCGSWSNPIDKLSPYKMDVQQGNVISQDMLSKLKPGMTRSQVRFILGTPLVQDAFHPNRWDYVYRYSKSGSLTEQRRVTVVFEDEKLLAVEGDVVAGDPAKAAPIASGGDKK